MRTILGITVLPKTFFFQNTRNRLRKRAEASNLQVLSKTTNTSRPNKIVTKIVSSKNGHSPMSGTPSKMPETPTLMIKKDMTPERSTQCSTQEAITPVVRITFLYLI